MNKDAKWLAWLEQQFSRISGESRQISLHDFTEVLQVKEVCAWLFKVVFSDRGDSSQHRFSFLIMVENGLKKELRNYQESTNDFIIFFSCSLRSSFSSCSTKIEVEQSVSQSSLTV